VQELSGRGSRAAAHARRVAATNVPFVLLLREQASIDAAQHGRRHGGHKETHDSRKNQDDGLEQRLVDRFGPAQSAAIAIEGARREKERLQEDAEVRAGWNDAAEAVEAEALAVRILAAAVLLLEILQNKAALVACEDLRAAAAENPEQWLGNASAQNHNVKEACFELLRAPARQRAQLE